MSDNSGSFFNFDILGFLFNSECDLLLCFSFNFFNDLISNIKFFILSFIFLLSSFFDFISFIIESINPFCSLIFFFKCELIFLLSFILLIEMINLISFSLFFDCK